MGPKSIDDGGSNIIFEGEDQSIIDDIKDVDIENNNDHGDDTIEEEKSEENIEEKTEVHKVHRSDTKKIDDEHMDDAELARLAAEYDGERESLNKTESIENIPELSADELNILKPKKTCIHVTFEVYRYIAAFAALNMSVGVFVSLCLFELTLIEYVIRVFMSAICVFIVISEVGGDSGTTTLCGGSMMYPSWIVRGTLYAFLGVIGVSQWETADLLLNEKMLVAYICAVSWMMIVAGMVYLISGIFCCQRLKESVVDDYAKRCEHSLSLEKKLTK